MAGVTIGAGCPVTAEPLCGFTNQANDVNSCFANRRSEVRMSRSSVSVPESVPADTFVEVAPPLIPALPNGDPDIAAVQKKSWSSLQRSLVMCHEMDVYSKATIDKLAEGALKLQHLDEYQSKMERDLMETAVHLDEMQKCCGIFPNPWAKSKGTTGAEGVQQEAKLEYAIDKAMTTAPTEEQKGPLALQPGFQKDIRKPKCLVIIADDYTELQMEKNLDMIDGYLDKLELASNEITDKLHTESRTLDSAGDFMDKNVIRVTLARKKALATLNA